MAAVEPKTSRRSLAWLTPALLILAGAAALALTHQIVAPVDIGGSDPGMWEDAARKTALGDPSPIAPFFPFVLATLHSIAGLPYDKAGLAISALSYIALAPVTWWLAKSLGAPSWLGGLAALCVLGNPWLACSAWQCQPDTLTALAFALAVVLARRWLLAPGWGTLAPLLLLTGLLPQVREHAAVVSLALLVLMALAPGRWHQRGLRVLLAATAIVLLPILAGEAPDLPWRLAWVHARWGEVIAHFFSSEMPFHLQGTPRDYQQAFADSYAEGSRLDIALLHARLSFKSGPSPWIWLGLAGLSLPLLGGRRWVVLVGLAPAVSVLGGAQQPRHLAVLLPIAAACWVTAMARFATRERVVLVLITAVGACALTASTDGLRAANNLRATAEQRNGLRSLAEGLCAQLPPDAIYLGEQPRTLIYCDREFMPFFEAEATDRHLYWIGGGQRSPPQPPQVMARTGWRPMTIEGIDHFVLHRPPPASAGD